MLLSKLSLATAASALAAASVSEAFSVAPRLALGATRERYETAIFSEKSVDDKQKSEEKQEEEIKAEILQPFPPAADPLYSVKGPVGENPDKFVISRYGEPTKEELSNENLFAILYAKSSDLEANTLVWKCLGYRFDDSVDPPVWNNEKVFPKWREKFPSPPDLIGMQRIYSKEVDQPSLKSNQQLVRSVPADNKQSLKTHLRPLGFTGFKLAELTPNKTRRAQCANWLLYFREELFGYTVEELRERRRLKQEAQRLEEERLEQERIQKLREMGKKDDQEKKDQWKPPVKEVF